MTQAWAETLVDLSSLYLFVGVVFAAAFLAWGVRRIDPAARGASWGFRVVIAPGAVALWPLLAWRWWRSTGEAPTESTAHREAAR